MAADGREKRAEIRQWLRNVRAARPEAPYLEEVDDRGLISNPGLPSPFIIFPTNTTHRSPTHPRPQTDDPIELSITTTSTHPSVAKLSRLQSPSRAHVGSLGNIFEGFHSSCTPRSGNSRPRSASRAWQLREASESEKSASHQADLLRRKSLSPLPDPVLTLDLPAFAPRGSIGGPEKRRPLVNSSSFSGLPPPKTQLTAPSKSFPLADVMPKSAPVSPNLSGNRKHFQHTNTRERYSERSPKTLTRQKKFYSEEDISQMDMFVKSGSSSTSDSSSPALASSCEERRSSEDDALKQNDLPGVGKQVSEPRLPSVMTEMSSDPCVVSMATGADPHHGKPIPLSRVEEACQKEESSLTMSATPFSPISTALVEAPQIPSMALSPPGRLAQPWGEEPGRQAEAAYKRRLKAMALQSFSFDDEGLLPVAHRRHKFLTKRSSPPPLMTSHQPEPRPHSPPSLIVSVDHSQSAGSSSTSHSSGSSDPYRRGSLNTGRGSLFTEGALKRASHDTYRRGSLKTPAAFHGPSYQEVDRTYRLQHKQEPKLDALGRHASTHPSPFSPSSSATSLTSSHGQTARCSDPSVQEAIKLPLYASTAFSQLCAEEVGVGSDKIQQGRGCVNRQDSGIGTLSTYTD